MSDPDFKPLWMRDDDTPREPNIDPEVIAMRENQRAHEGVARVAMERTEDDSVVLPDGRRCKLHKRLVIEMPGTIEGATEKRTQEFWTGPKQMRLIIGDEMTPLGMLKQVVFGFPNHLPTLDDVRQVRAGFFPSEHAVMYVVPTPAEVDPDPQARFMVHLLAMPAIWSTSPIHLL